MTNVLTLKIVGTAIVVVPTGPHSAKFVVFEPSVNTRLELNNIPDTSIKFRIVIADDSGCFTGERICTYRDSNFHHAINTLTFDVCYG